MIAATDCQQEQILAVMKPGFDYTYAELCRDAELMINTVTTCLRDLMEQGRVEHQEYDVRRCTVTGGMAKVVRLCSEGG